MKNPLVVVNLGGVTEFHYIISKFSPVEKM